MMASMCGGQIGCSFRSKRRALTALLVLASTILGLWASKEPPLAVLEIPAAPSSFAGFKPKEILLCNQRVAWTENLGGGTNPLFRAYCYTEDGSREVHYCYDELYHNGELVWHIPAYHPEPEVKEHYEIMPYRDSEAADSVYHS